MKHSENTHVKQPLSSTSLLSAPQMAQRTETPQLQSNQDPFKRPNIIPSREPTKNQSNQNRKLQAPGKTKRTKTEEAIVTLPDLVDSSDESYQSDYSRPLQA